MQENKERNETKPIVHRYVSEEDTNKAIDNKNLNMIRLNKFISDNTEISRRTADAFIQNGKVTINDRIAVIGEKVNPETQIVKVNGDAVKTRTAKLYIALNKPEGYITTRNDEMDRQTVMELIPKHKNLKPVGRLDKDTEGLLIFTNDGQYINTHTHPSFKCEKEYFVKINGRISDESVKQLREGIIIEEGKRKTAPAQIQVLKTRAQESSVRITIHEGRNRQIRKMFAKVGHNVKYLKRIRVEHIQMGYLKKGTYRKLTKEEIND